METYIKNQNLRRLLKTIRANESHWGWVNELALQLVLQSDIVYVWIIIWRHFGKHKHRGFTLVHILTFTHSVGILSLSPSQSPSQPWKRKNCINSLGIHVANLGLLHTLLLVLITTQHRVEILSLEVILLFSVFYDGLFICLVCFYFGYKASVCLHWHPFVLGKTFFGAFASIHSILTLFFTAFHFLTHFQSNCFA